MREGREGGAYRYEDVGFEADGCANVERCFVAEDFYLRSACDVFVLGVIETGGQELSPVEGTRRV